MFGTLCLGHQGQHADLQTRSGRSGSTSAQWPNDPCRQAQQLMWEGTPFVVRGCGRSKMMSWAPEVMDRVAREAEPLPGVQARQTLQARVCMLRQCVHRNPGRRACTAIDHALMLSQDLRDAADARLGVPPLTVTHAQHNSVSMHDDASVT